MPFNWAPPDIWIAWIVLSSAMAIYWWVRCRGRCILTFDVFFVGMYLYMPIVFMSLFAFSPWNEPATGDWYWLYVGRTARGVLRLGVRGGSVPADRRRHLAVGFAAAGL